MKNLILYYSYSGNTKSLAQKKAASESADTEEIVDIKKRGVFLTLFAGCFKALTRKTAKIRPIKANLKNYGKIIIMAPIWAGHPAPPFNNIINALPEGRKVELIFTSDGGSSMKSSEKTKALIAAKGCEVIGYTDIKTKGDSV